MGDQFDQSNKHLSKYVFDAFYWIINFGSLFASLLMPIFLRDFGPAIAFGIPGLLMFIATFFFWLGRKKYVHVPPAPANPDSFTRVAWTALTAHNEGEPRPGLMIALLGALAGIVALAFSAKIGFVIAFCSALALLLAFGGAGTWMQLERARGKHSDEAIEGVRAVLRILVIFALVTPFWSLFDQKASTWILQANEMSKPTWIEPSQMQLFNPALVLLLIPFNNLVLYPLLKKIGYEATALRRMSAGIAFSGLAWIAVGGIQIMMDDGNSMNIFWQLLPYALLTFGEVLVSATGLEFAYSQAPRAMKGVIMSFWYLSVTMGNLWVLIVNALVRNDGVTSQIASTGMSVPAFQMFFFAGFALLAALAFMLYAKRYKMQDNYRKI